MLTPLWTALEALPKLLYLLRGAVLRRLIVLAGGQCGTGLRVEAGLRLRHRLHSGYCLGQDVYIGRECVIDCPVGGRFHIGDRAPLTHGVFISAQQAVHLGCDVLVGEYCSLRDANHDIMRTDIPINQQPMIAKGIEIADDVWLGRGVAVLAGAVIGRGCVIGANAVVLDAPLDPFSVYAGVPVRKIRMRTASCHSSS